MFLRIVVAGLVLAGFGSLAVGGQSRGGLRYESLAHDFLGDLGAHPSPDTPPSMRTLINERFVQVDLGAFEVVYPASDLGDAERAKELQKVCGALVEAERRWFEWMEPSEERRQRALPQLEALAEWIEDWKPRDLELAVAGGGGELLALLGAPEPLRNAPRVIADELRAVAPGSQVAGQLPVHMMLLPTRSLFVEFLCYAGWSRPALRDNYWVSGVETWTHAFLDDLRVYAMEYATTSGAWHEGTSMNRKSKTGLEEQLVQLALGDLFDQLYRGSIPPSLVGGICNNLVIDLYGRVDTRVDGDLAGSRTDARVTFVPGGLPYGGVLPQSRADSSWRSRQGKDYFIGVLRSSQKAGKKGKKLPGSRSRNPLANFVLQPVGKRDRHVVDAPILGPQAADQSELPQGLQGEYQEFLRAYRSAFLHWLRNKGAGKQGPSRTSFPRLLGAIADAGSASEMDQGFIDTYGVPLSNAKTDRNSLEGRFLTWLGKQRAR